MPKFLTLALSCAVVVLGLTACGGSSSSSSSASTSSSTPATSSAGSSSSTAPAPAAAAGGSPAVAADPSGQLKFTKSSLGAKAGKVTIRFTNASPIGHNLTIQQGTSGPTVGATATFQGGSKTLSLNLKPGTYTFYCSVPGHRAGGMVGTLTVT
jgi:plastocyanin